MFKKCYSSNKEKWVAASFSISARFTAKFNLVFILTQENTFSWGFYIKVNRESIVSSKRQICLTDWHVFMSPKILNVFNTSTLKKIFWKTNTFFKKLEYSFLAQSTKIEKTIFPYKTALSEANVKTNRMGNTRWTYHKERGFASNYFIFLKILFQFIKCWFDVPTT